MGHCDLKPGDVIFYERFAGVDIIKDRYFIVISNDGSLVNCFTTTTQPHAEKSPRLAAEFCELAAGECCLPKRCFVDLRTVHEFWDTELSSRLRSKSVKQIGYLPAQILKKLHDALLKCRSLSQDEKEPLLLALAAEIGET